MKSLLVVFLGTTAVVAQDQDTVRGPWTHGLLTGLTATQVSFTDWAQGGQNAFSWTTTLTGKHDWEEGVYDWGNSYKLAYGQAEIGGAGIRKTDDKIDLESILSYKMGRHIDPYVAVTFKSQFTKGYIYRSAGDSLVSDLSDPAYITQSAGFGFRPIPQVKTRAGAALREVITSRYTQYADDPKTPAVEKTRVEGGLESVTSVEWKFAENMVFSSDPPGAVGSGACQTPFRFRSGAGDLQACAAPSLWLLLSTRPRRGEACGPL